MMGRKLGIFKNVLLTGEYKLRYKLKRANLKKSLSVFASLSLALAVMLGILGRVFHGVPIH